MLAYLKNLKFKCVLFLNQNIHDTVMKIVTFKNLLRKKKVPFLATSFNGCLLEAG